MLGGKFSGAIHDNAFLCAGGTKIKAAHDFSALFFLTKVNHLANVVRLRWAYFTHRVLIRLWGQSSKHGPDQNCHSRGAPAQS
jgi:hypothetical protein